MNAGYRKWAILCATRVTNNNFQKDIFGNTLLCVQGMSQTLATNLLGD